MRLGRLLGGAIDWPQSALATPLFAAAGLVETKGRGTPGEDEKDGPWIEGWWRSCR